eukprot:544043_1
MCAFANNWVHMHTTMLALMILITMVKSSALGVDVSTAYSESTWSCLHKQYNIDFMVSRAWREEYQGAFDETSVTNSKNALSAGIKEIDMYLFPCRSTDPVKQVTELMGNLTKNNVYFGMLWLDIEEETYETCNWSNYTNEQNCEYIHSMAEAGTNMGQLIGIYSGHHGWGSVFHGNYSACPSANIYPLWFAHYDNKTNFNDYNSLKIGGWELPSIKQYYGDANQCNADVDLDWTQWY